MAFGKKKDDKGSGDIPSIESYTSISSEEYRRELHTTSTALPTPTIRTVLVDVATEQEFGFWDEPLWLSVGAILEGGTDLWEIVSTRLYIPTVTPEQPRRPILYLYASRVEA
ncbi:MAG: hypothetical protein U0W40_12565 [Acidimicrobiia bacterium]